MISFYKYHGAGNDFILINDWDASFNTDDSELISRMCNRHFGIGADGLMLLRSDKEYDFRMIYFNSDGQYGSMCGNGGRCIVAMANALGIITGETVFIASDGKHRAKVGNNGIVSLEMLPVSEIEELNQKVLIMNTGSPHYVKLVDNVDTLNLIQEARLIRNSERFKKEGINVNFFQKTLKGIKVRTYERGVEDETLACGTGVTACAIAAHRMGIAESAVDVEALGGNLTISFESNGKGYSNIWKTGPTQFVFEGKYHPDLGINHG
jgi:diaminopimelate epimerase